MNKKILIVDDDPGQRSLFESFLKLEGYQVLTASSGTDALAVVEKSGPELLLSDVRMPGMSGLELQQELRRRGIGTPILLITAYADIREAVAAIRDGAVDYLEKPVDLNELLKQIKAILGENPDAGRKRTTIPPLPDGVIAGSKVMKDVLKEVAIVAPSDSRALIYGESGTGKEVIADVIHRWSARKNKPFVKVNCAAIPENLLESELFGHEKGSFTGAASSRIGKFEQADGGTILLDEMAEMSPNLQVKLLRITQNGSFCKVGSNVEQRVDVRILTTTNRDLEKEVIAGHFREDLFYRLNVFDIYLPPLRDRKADILPLAISCSREFGQSKPRFSPVAVCLLENYNWPGNVRELRNAIERAILLARGDVILPEHLPKRLQQTSETSSANDEISASGNMEEIERKAILRSLREHNFNRSEAARALGLSRRKMSYKLQTYREQGFNVDE